jgi:hypothetical protein
MPLYWFHFDMAQQPQEVAERIRSVVREAPGWLESFRTIWRLDETSSTPFIGTVGDDCFKIRRDIRYRNSFLPMIWGRIIPIQPGTHVKVVMYLHPVVALFDLIWFGAIGHALLIDSSSRSGLLVMFLFGVGLTVGGFFPEAFKAKRLLSNTLNSGQDEATSRVPARVPGNRANS